MKTVMAAIAALEKGNPIILIRVYRIENGTALKGHCKLLLFGLKYIFD